MQPCICLYPLNGATHRRKLIRLQRFLSAMHLKQALPRATCSVTICCNDKRLSVMGGRICRACLLLLLTGTIAFAHLLMYAFVPSGRQLQQANPLPAEIAASVDSRETTVSLKKGPGIHTYSRCRDCRSQEWAPYVVQKCEPGVAAHFAPCLALQAARRGISVLKAEELLYPDAELLLPGFLDQKQRAYWLMQRDIMNSPRLKWSNISADMAIEYIMLSGGSGQNWIFRNARYTDDPSSGMALTPKCLQPFSVL